MTQLKDATVLLTGAAGGFGQLLTQQLLAAHSQLILSDLETVLAQLPVSQLQHASATGKILACLPADLSSASGCQDLYTAVKVLDTPVDMVINNAGVGCYGRMDEIPTEQWEQLMQINLLAPMHLSARFAGEMISRRSGHIVNISSLAGWIAPAGLAPYGASKFGLRGFSMALRKELQPYNVRVTIVYPFFSRTPILRSPAYGSYGSDYAGFPEAIATDPAQVIAATLRGIQRNQAEIFPDRIAQILHLLQRFSPQFLNWLTPLLSHRIQQ